MLDFCDRRALQSKFVRDFIGGLFAFPRQFLNGIGFEGTLSG